MGKQRLNYREVREQALAHVLEAQRLLEGLIERPEHIAGSPPEFALYPIEDAVGYLTPDEGDTTMNGRPVQLVVDNTSPEARP